ncbi:MAG TPA: MFS transporter [Candidatus Dormibacteraeota bacterium]|nr:MFS transporter [Candidatus Dormibacteraeota bacterium]
MAGLFALFNPNLPPKVWLLQFGVLINFFGNGLVAPFLVIYLHFGRDIPFAVAGAAVALGGFTAVTSGLVAGALADRIGPRNTLAGAMFLNAVAYLLYTQVTTSWHAFGVGLLVGVGTGSYGPSCQLLIASMVSAEKRREAFAQNRVTSVAGLGLGGIVGGVLAAAGLSGYLRILVLDAATFFAFAAVVLLLPSGRSAVSATARGSYRAVLRDGPFVRLAVTNLGMVSAGIAPMFWLLPAYAKGQLHIGETIIGVIYAANTLTVVLAQLPLARLTQGRNPMQALRTGALIWVACWLVCVAAAAAFDVVVAAVAVGLAAIAYAVGECLYSSIMLPTATLLAPDHLRGRYLGVMGLAWQGGFFIGPSVGGAILGVFAPALPIVCAIGCLAAAGASIAADRSLASDIRMAPLGVAS